MKPLTQTILTIDDDPSITELIAATLSPSGYRVLKAGEGFKGLNLAKQESVDLILLDVAMPEMGGEEVVRRLKDDPTTRQIPVIMLTALSREGDKVAGLDAGADEYLTKPIAATELRARVRAMLRMRDLQEELVRLERERHEAQLAFARDLQQGLLPSELPHLPGVEFAIRYQPCETIGGDFYDFISLGEDKLYLILGDAEGHGVRAALLMAAARAYVRSSLGTDDFSPARLITRVNELICRDPGHSALLPMICVLFDLSAAQISYASAGHESLLFLQAAQGKCIPLKNTGPVFGIVEDAAYEERKFPLIEGDLLVCFTDGLTEGFDRDKSAFGLNRVEMLSQAHKGRPADQIASEILSAWREHSGDQAGDDMTLIVARCVTVKPQEKLELGTTGI